MTNISGVDKYLPIECCFCFLTYKVSRYDVINQTEYINTNAELQDAVEEVLPALREQGISIYILTDHVTTEGMKSLTDKIKLASDEPVPADLRANISFNTPAAYIYTSGTTGKTGVNDRHVIVLCF